MTLDREPEELSADEVASRIGAVGAFPRGLERPQPAAGHASPLIGREPAELHAPEPAPVGPPEPRVRLIRDSAATLASLTAIALLVFAVMPPAPDGGILTAIGTPSKDSPDVVGATGTPGDESAGSTAPEGGGGPVENPEPTEPPPADADTTPSTGGTLEPVSTPQRRTDPTAAPTREPAPVASTAPPRSPPADAEPTPTPIGGPPGGTPTPDPTPEPTPPPPATPDGTPEPTPSPDPTPTPTEDPTTTPGATPEPTPTPEPTAPDPAPGS